MDSHKITKAIDSHRSSAEYLFGRLAGGPHRAGDKHVIRCSDGSEFKLELDRVAKRSGDTSSWPIPVPDYLNPPSAKVVLEASVGCRVVLLTRYVRHLLGNTFMLGPEAVAGADSELKHDLVVEQNDRIMLHLSAWADPVLFFLPGEDLPAFGLIPKQIVEDTVTISYGLDTNKVTHFS